MESAVISRPSVHGIGSMADRDPLTTLRQCLQTSLHPKDYWPSASYGHLELLHACGPSRMKPSRRSNHERKQKIYDDFLAGVSHSAISVSCEKSWRYAVRISLCMLDRRDSAIICCSTFQRQQLVLLLRRMQREEFQLSGGMLHDPPVLLVGQLAGQQFQEVFVAPEINPESSSQQDLIAVVNAAKVGLHLVAEPRS